MRLRWGQRETMMMMMVGTRRHRETVEVGGGHERSEQVGEVGEEDGEGAMKADVIVESPSGERNGQ
jgi:hypothetical protein